MSTIDSSIPSSLPSPIPSTTASSNSNEGVRVLIRVRPSSTPSFRESQLQIDPYHGSIEVRSSPPQRFQYDGVAGPNATQAEMFDQVGKPMSEKVLQGYNGTIFAYGQTGSGKTHTMQGPIDSTAAGELTASAGLMPRVFQFLFQRMSAESAGQPIDSTLTFSVSCSFLEIYNEKIWDLLSPSSQALNLREDPKGAVFVEGLTTQAVKSANECEEWLSRGVLNRRVGETAMNRESSRSHSVFQIFLRSTLTRADGRVTERSSTLNLIDLAGSERQRDTLATGERLKEAVNINKSLSSLALVIRALVDVAQGKERHVHYRDSKLTHLLRDSLGGNSLCCIVACISSSPDHLPESVSTLQFASRAKKMKNSAKINESQQMAKMEELQNENRKLQELIQKLQQQKQNNETSNGVVVNGVNGANANGVESEASSTSFGSSVSGSSCPTDPNESNLLALALSRESDWMAANSRLENLLKAQESLATASEKRSSQLQMMMKMRDRTIEMLSERVREMAANASGDERVAQLDAALTQLNELIELQNASAFPTDLTREVLIRSQALAIARLQERVNTLDHSISEHNHTLHQHNQNCYRLHMNAHVLTVKLLSAESQRDLIQAELNSLKGKSKEKSIELESVRSEAELLKEEKKLLKGELESVRRTFEKEKLEMMERYAALELGATKGSNAGSEGELARLEEIQRLQKELEAARADSQRLLEENGVLSAELRSEKSANQSAERRIAELQSHCEELSAGKETAAAELESVRFELDSLMEDHEILMSELNELKLEKEEWEMNSKPLGQGMDNGKQNNAAEEERYRELEETNRELRLAVQALNSRAEKAESELQDVESALNGYKQENSKLLERQVQLLGHQNPKQKILGLMRLKGENEQLRVEKENLEKEIKKWKGKFTGVNGNNGAVNNSLAATVVNKENERANLNLSANSAHFTSLAPGLDM